MHHGGLFSVSFGKLKVLSLPHSAVLRKNTFQAMIQKDENIVDH